MRILITGDLHFNQPQFRWIEEQQDCYDCICLTGDLINCSLNNFNEQTEWVSNWIKAFSKNVFICSGNHDLDDLGECDWLNSLKSKKVCVDNQIKNIQGTKFGCIPYLGATLSDFYDCDILLNHIPPNKTSTSIDANTKKDWGDNEIYAAIKSKTIHPEYIFCGHVENPMKTNDKLLGVKIINPGQHGDKIPLHKIIVLKK